MDSPEFVAKRAIEGMVNKELHVIFGGEKRAKENVLNFENPEKLDAEIAKIYEEKKEASFGHKAL